MRDPNNIERNEELDSMVIDTFKELESTYNLWKENKCTNKDLIDKVAEFGAVVEEFDWLIEK